MAKTREELLAFAQRSHIEVMGVRLQSLSELEKAHLDALWGKRYNETKEVDFVMRRELLVRCIVDDEGNRLFSDDEADLLAEWDSKVTSKLYKKARDLCGLDADEGEEGKGSSSADD